MTDSEITALAREYAEEIYPNLSDKIISLRTQEIKNAERLIRFLLRRFSLVEKSEVERIYNLNKRRLHATHGLTSASVVELLESLFPEIAKEEEE